MHAEIVLLVQHFWKKDICFYWILLEPWSVQFEQTAEREHQRKQEVAVRMSDVN